MTNGRRIGFENFEIDAANRLLLRAGSGAYNAQWHPRVSKIEKIIYEDGTSTPLSSTVTMDYDGTTSLSAPLNPTITKQYGFSTTIGSLGSLEKSAKNGAGVAIVRFYLK